MPTICLSVFDHFSGLALKGLIRLVKRSLRNVLGNLRIDYEQILTALKEVKNFIDNKRLTCCYANSDMTELVTPKKLFHGRNLDIYSSLDNLYNYEYINKRAMHLQLIINNFWKRWKHEYLTELREFNKLKLKYDRRDKPKLGSIVLTEDDKYKNWKIGRTKDLMLSSDDKFQAEFVDTIISGKINTIKQPIKKIFPTEMVKGMKNEKIRFVVDNDAKGIKIDGGQC